jgi:hypothetical protein
MTRGKGMLHLSLLPERQDLNMINSPAFQAVFPAVLSSRGSLTRGYENKALRASDRCNEVVFCLYNKKLFNHFPV